MKYEGSNLNAMTTTLKSFARVLNQFSSHWLLFDALHSASTMCFKNKEEVTYPPPQVNLIDDDYGIAFELYLFVTNIKKWFVMF